MFQEHGSRRTFGIAQPVPLAQDRIDPGLLAARRIVEIDRPIGAGRHAGAARDAEILGDLAHRSGGDHGIVGQKRQDPAGRSVSLADRLGQVLGILRRPAQVDAFGGEIDGSQLDMGFLEIAVRSQRHLEHPGDVLAVRSREHGGGERDRIGIERQLPAQDRVGHGDFQDAAAILLDGLHLRPVMRLVTDEPDILVRRVAVIILAEPVGPHVAEQHVDIHLPVDGLELQSVLHGAAAADAGAVVAVFLPAAHALDHHQALRVDEPIVLAADPLLQLQVGHHPVIVAIEVFGRLVLVGTDRDDRRAMLDLSQPALRLHPGDEISHIAGHVRDGGVGDHMDQRMPVDLVPEIAEVGLHVEALQGVAQPARDSPQV